ncbi:MAG: Dabb family protein [Clostridia bacterium]|nr:Dabb family protein [Clostridia bacterium]
MIRHIVMFKIKEEFKSEIPQLVKNFYGMKGKIEGMLDLEAGADILGSPRSYDIALVTVFKDRESFDAYQTHPVHQPVRKRMHEVRETSVACDFLLPDEE